MPARSRPRTSRPRPTARFSRFSRTWPRRTSRLPARKTASRNTMMSLTTNKHAMLVIGLVSVSDRASGGVYEDKGIPALTDWLAGAITTAYRIEPRLIPDERALIERTLIELVDQQRCH